MRTRTTYANVAATIALLIAITGVSPVQAAGRLLTGANIKDGSLTGIDVRNGSITSVDIAARSISSAQIKDRTITLADLSADLQARLTLPDAASAPVAGSIQAQHLSIAVQASLARADSALTRVVAGPVVSTGVMEGVSHCPEGTSPIGGAFFVGSGATIASSRPSATTSGGIANTLAATGWAFSSKNEGTNIKSLTGQAICVGR